MMPMRVMCALFAMMAFAACASGPTGAARKISDAVQAGDAKALEPHVAWPELRDNLKRDLTLELTRRVELGSGQAGGKPPQGSAEALGKSLFEGLSGMVVAQMVDALATPEGVIGAIETGRLAGALQADAIGLAGVLGGGAGAKPAANGAKAKLPRTTILRRGMAEDGYEILFGPPGGTPNEAFRATLALRDGQWKLIRIEPPKSR